MTNFSELIKAEFPSIDDDLKQYVEGYWRRFQSVFKGITYFNIAGVLENGADEFQDSEDVYEAIGGVLHEVSADKSEADIKYVVTRLLVIIVCSTIF